MGPPQSTIKTMFSSSLRSGALRQWEPIFIGTKKDPTYDPRLTWEGRADKMVIINLFIKRYILLLLAVHSETQSLQAIWQFSSHIGSSMLLSFVLGRSYIMWYYQVSWGNLLHFCQCPESSFHTDLTFIAILQVEGVKMCLRKCLFFIIPPSWIIMHTLQSDV